MTQEIPKKNSHQDDIQKQDDNTSHTTQPCTTGKSCKCNCDTKQLVRLLFMLLFVAIKCVAVTVFYCIAAFQFFSSLFKKTPNQHLLDFNQSLSAYLYQIFLFVGYNTETKPFPFNPWPKPRP